MKSEASAAVADGAEAHGGREAIPKRLLVRYLLTFGGMLAVVGLLHFYLLHTLVLAPNWGTGGTALGAGLLGAAFLLIPASLLASRLPRRPLTHGIMMGGYFWLGTFQLLLGLAVMVDVAFFLWRALSSPGAEEALRLARLEAGVLLAGLGVALPLGVRSAMGPARLEQVRIPVKGLPPALEGLRIAFVSDLHVGETLKRRWLKQLVDRVNALEPHLIGVGGDLVDGTVDELRDEVAPLRELRAPLGVYYVTGNHEYYHGGPAWAEEVRRLGLTVLLNEHKVVTHQGAQLTVAGVTDWEGERFHPGHACRPDLAFQGAPSGVPRLLFAHQPKVAKLAAPHDVSLQLSGHTHGGQIFPFMFFVKLQQPVVRGFHVVDGVPVYTGRGTGYWGPPIRVGAPPELTLVTLVRS